MDSDFRLGLRSTFGNIKVKKEDVVPEKVEPKTAVEPIVEKVIIKEEKLPETKVRPIETKVEIPEVVEVPSEKTEFDSIEFITFILKIPWLKTFLFKT